MKGDHRSDHAPFIELISFSQKDFREVTNAPIEDILAQYQEGQVNWINVDGHHPPAVYDALGKRFGLHTLLIEDITTESQPKAEEYDDYLFFTLKMLHHITSAKVEYEQISFILGKDYLISFQEKTGDFFGPLRERLRKDSGRTRKMQPDQLLHRLLDIILDQYFVILEDVGTQMEKIEEEIVRNPTPAVFRRIQHVKKELIFLRKALYPLRDAISKLSRTESDLVSEENNRYFTDLFDHTLQLISSLDTYRDLTTSLMDIHINSLNTRMNEVIKVLAIISTVFMPLTFIVGVYGMNFKFMPELLWPYGYPYVLTLVIIVTLSMIGFFRYKKWF